MVKFRGTLFLFTLLIIGGFKVHAQNMVPGIIVELANGQKVEYMLTDKPKMVFDGSKITLTTESVVVEYTPTALIKVRTGEVKNTGTDIEEMVIQSGNIEVNAGFVRLSGFSIGESVSIYTLSGNLYASYHVSDNGSLVIPISTLPLGISIIKVNDQSVKITRK